jgi:hypothetical protein
LAVTAGFYFAGVAQQGAPATKAGIDGLPNNVAQRGATVATPFSGSNPAGYAQTLRQRRASESVRGHGGHQQRPATHLPEALVTVLAPARGRVSSPMPTPPWDWAASPSLARTRC